MEFWRWLKLSMGSSIFRTKTKILHTIRKVHKTMIPRITLANHQVWWCGEIRWHTMAKKSQAKTINYSQRQFMFTFGEYEQQFNMLNVHVQMWHMFYLLRCDCKHNSLRFTIFMKYKLCLISFVRVARWIEGKCCNNLRFDGITHSLCTDTYVLWTLFDDKSLRSSHDFVRYFISSLFLSILSL